MLYIAFNIFIYFLQSLGATCSVVGSDLPCPRPSRSQSSCQVSEPNKTAWGVLGQKMSSFIFFPLRSNRQGNDLSFKYSFHS